MTEQEEFEFRLRMEQEEGGKKFEPFSAKDAALRGLLDLPYLPYTLAEMAGSDWARDFKKAGYRAVGISPEEPNLKPSDKLAYEGLRGVTSNVYFAPAIPFQVGGPAVTAGVRGLFGALSGGVGGVTSEASGQLAEDAGAGPKGQLAARMFGGMLGGTLAEGGIVRAGKEAAMTAVEQSMGGTKGQLARHTITEIGGLDKLDEGMAALEKERQLFGEMYRPLSDSVFPDALTLSKAKTARIATAPLDKQASIIEQMGNTVKAVQNKANQLFGEPGESLVDALTLARQRYGDDAAGLAAGIARNDAELMHFTDQLARKEVGSFSNVNKLHKMLIQRQKLNRDAFNMMYAKLDADAAKAGVTFNPTAVTNAITDTAITREMQNVPGVNRAVDALARLEDAASKGPVPFSLLKEASERVNDGFYETMNNPALTQAHGLFARLKKSINEAKTTVSDPDILARWESIGKRYDDNYRQVFQRGLGYFIKDAMEKNVSEVLESRLISQDGARQFKKVFGAGAVTGDTRHMDYLTEIAWSKFLKGEGAISNGVINRNAIDRFLAKNEDFFREFDNWGGKGNPIRESFKGNADTLRGILARRDDLMESTKTLESSALKKMTGFNNFSDAVTAATKNNEILGTIHEVSRDLPDVSRGLKRELLTQMMAEGDKANDFFVKNRHVFRALFPGEEYNDAAMIAGGWSKAQRQWAPPPHAKTVEKSVLEQQMGQDFSTLAATMRRPIISWAHKWIVAGSRVVDRRRAIKIEDDVMDVLTDPAVLKEAAMSARKGDWEKFSKDVWDGLKWSVMRNTVRTLSNQESDVYE